MIDGLNAPCYDETQYAPFIYESVKSSAVIVCYKNIEERKHWETLPNSPLGFDKRGRMIVYKRRDPWLSNAGLDPLNEIFKKFKILHDLINI